MDSRELLLTLVIMVVSLILVVAFASLGWYAVWKLFLSRFGFVQELLGNHQEAGAASEDVPRANARPRGSRKQRRD